MRAIADMLVEEVELRESLDSHYYDAARQVSLQVAQRLGLDVEQVRSMLQLPENKQVNG